MSEWKIYEGTDEQIEEMRNAEDGFIIRSRGIESKIMHKIDRRGLLVPCDEYLICEEHPLADMIVRWARTGQPVWWRPINSQIWGTEASWSCDYIPWSSNSEYEFSFAPFDEEK